MTSLPLKQQYGPTLGQLLSPRWRATSPALRGLLIALVPVLLIAIVGILLSIQDARYSHGGRVPFSFEYKGLFRTAPEAGGYVKVARLDGGSLEDSFEVAPLRLPPYRGSVTGALPLYAAGYIRQLRSRYGTSFQVDGEGKTRINTVAAYNLYYSALINGRTIFGRDILITPERAAVRDGMLIEMLTLSTADPHVTSSTLVASTGLLKRPLETFTFE